MFVNFLIMPDEPESEEALVEDSEGAEKGRGAADAGDDDDAGDAGDGDTA